MRPLRSENPSLSLSLSLSISPRKQTNSLILKRKTLKKTEVLLLVFQTKRVCIGSNPIVVVYLAHMASSVVAEKGGLGFEETKLRLGLPGGGGAKDGGNKSSGKRGFDDTIDLKLKLNTNCGVDVSKKDESVEVAKVKVKKPAISSMVDPEKPPASKAQVVGWPPVRSFRKNVMSVQSTKAGKDENDKSGQTLPAVTAAFVKVSMDGAPYLRKVDLKMYKSYQELSAALEKMFSSFTIGNCGSQGINFMNESKLMDLLNGSEYVPTYEDKDGDWMLVGDVPWEMFVESCKRMRIMKGSEAIGLAPRAMEKCKNRS